MYKWRKKWKKWFNSVSGTRHRCIGLHQILKTFFFALVLFKTLAIFISKRFFYIFFSIFKCAQLIMPVSAYMVTMSHTHTLTLGRQCMPRGDHVVSQLALLSERQVVQQFWSSCPQQLQQHFRRCNTTAPTYYSI